MLDECLNWSPWVFFPIKCVTLRSDCSFHVVQHARMYTCVTVPQFWLAESVSCHHFCVMTFKTNLKKKKSKWLSLWDPVAPMIVLWLYFSIFYGCQAINCFNLLLLHAESFHKKLAMPFVWSTISDVSGKLCRFNSIISAFSWAFNAFGTYGFHCMCRNQLKVGLKVN